MFSRLNAERLTRAGWRLVTTAAFVALVALALVPSLSAGAQSGYPANAVLSTYFDARYCGNGAVSVVTDGGGVPINVCTSTGQRIVPVYPDYGVGTVYTASAYANTAYNYGAYAYGTASGAFGYGAYGNGAYGYANGAAVIRQYTDANTNCADDAVTETTAGYFCTNSGVPAFRV